VFATDYGDNADLNDVTCAQLLVLEGTDLRDVTSVGAIIADLIECPAGSSQWYFCAQVLDVGTGFPNQYRLARIFPMSQYVLGKAVDWAGCVWPVPRP
jgi:hypothetical protein